MRMSKRGKRALLSLLRQFQASEEGSTFQQEEGTTAPVGSVMDYLATETGREPLGLYVVKGIVTVLGSSESGTDRRTTRTYAVVGRTEHGAIATAIHAALADPTVVSAYDADFSVTAAGLGAWLASEGAEG